MGYIRHHAIICTSWDYKLITKAAKKARELGIRVLGPSNEVMNGYCSILFCPDGSKEGWDESVRGDDRRAAWKIWAASRGYEDGSFALEWCEVAYGADDAKAEVCDSEWMTSKAVSCFASSATTKWFVGGTTHDLLDLRLRSHRTGIQT